MRRGHASRTTDGVGGAQRAPAAPAGRVRHGHAYPSQVPSRTPDGVDDTQHQPHRHDCLSCCSLAQHHADRLPNRPQQHISHAITSCGLGTGGADCDGSEMRAHQAAATGQAHPSRRDASAPLTCKPHARRSRRCIHSTSRTGNASAPWACRPEPSAQPRARRSRRHTAPAAPT